MLVRKILCGAIAVGCVGSGVVAQAASADAPKLPSCQVPVEAISQETSNAAAAGFVDSQTGKFVVDPSAQKAIAEAVKNTNSDESRVIYDKPLSRWVPTTSLGIAPSGTYVYYTLTSSGTVQIHLATAAGDKLVTTKTGISAVVHGLTSRGFVVAIESVNGSVPQESYFLVNQVTGKVTTLPIPPTQQYDDVAASGNSLWLANSTRTTSQLLHFDVTTDKLTPWFNILAYEKRHLGYGRATQGDSYGYLGFTSAGDPILDLWVYNQPSEAQSWYGDIVIDGKNHESTIYAGPASSSENLDAYSGVYDIATGGIWMINWFANKLWMYSETAHSLQDLVLTKKSGFPSGDVAMVVGMCR